MIIFSCTTAKEAVHNRNCNFYHARNDGVLFSVVSVCVFVCLLVCQHDNSWTVRDITTKFSGHHPMVESADKFENGYIGVHRSHGRDVRPHRVFDVITPSPIDRGTGYCFRSISLFFLFLCFCVYLFLFMFFVNKVTRKRLDRFAWNFQGRCGVTMGRPDYIFDQFRETSRCRDAQHWDGVCCALAYQLVKGIVIGSRVCDCRWLLVRRGCSVSGCLTWAIASSSCSTQSEFPTRVCRYTSTTAVFLAFTSFCELQIHHQTGLHIPSLSVWHRIT